MSFFEPLPERNTPPEHVEYRSPPWREPPVNERPVALPIGAVLAQTPGVAVHVAGAYAYSTGLTFGVAMVRRRSILAEERRGGFVLESPLTEDDARFGVGFADGRRATADVRHGDEAPPAIVLEGRGGGGNNRSFEIRMWLWPLPPEGPVTFAFRWRSAGIEETLVEIDSAPLREAAARVVELWPDDRPEPPKPPPGALGWTAYAPRS